MQKVRYRLSFNRLYIKFQDLFHFSSMITFNHSFTLLFTIDVRRFSLRIWSYFLQSNNYILRLTHWLQLSDLLSFQILIALNKNKVV